jgi:aspartate racemase
MALEQSLNDIIRRHESLRTTFPAVDGRPVQAIAPALTFRLPLIDLGELPEPERQTEVWRLITESARWPFDLAQGPLFRAALLRLAEEEHILLLTVHHIVSDGWSMGVLLREISALYEAYSTGKPSPLPDLPIQYADFALWQRQWLRGEVLETHLGYWRQQLGGCLPILELPVDYPRPVVQTYQGDGESFLLSRQLTAAIKALSEREGTTLFMTLLAALNVLLYRYTDQHDITVGSPISGRDLVELEGLIGFFLNTLILRTDLTGNPSFQQVLQRVRETVLGAFAHQVIPLEELLGELQPERSLSHSPLFQVLFVFHDPVRSYLDLPDVVSSELDVEHGTTQFDLSLILRQTEQGLHALLRYNTDLFQAATIARMLGHFQTLLENIVADPAQPISQLSLLTEAERHQMLVDWNNTQVDFPEHLCFPELFEEQVAQTPDSVAVTCAEAQLTYRQLNARANHLARALIERGVGPDVMVAVLDERGIDLMTALIAILKAGGVYLPLDPRHPPQRYRRPSRGSRSWAGRNTRRSCSTG